MPILFWAIAFSKNLSKLPYKPAVQRSFQLAIKNPFTFAPTIFDCHKYKPIYNNINPFQY